MPRTQLFGRRNATSLASRRDADAAYLDEVTATIAAFVIFASYFWNNYADGQFSKRLNRLGIGMAIIKSTLQIGYTIFRSWHRRPASTQHTANEQ